MRERINGIGKPAEVRHDGARKRKSCRQNFRRDSRQARGSQLLLLRTLLCDYYAAFGIMQFTPDQVDNGSSDACGVASLNLDTFSCSEAGDNIIALTATDTQGNVDTCTATVFVADVPSSSPSLLPSTSPSERPSLSPSESPSDVSS